MQHKPLGRTGLVVSAFGLGTMTWGVQNSEAEAHAQLDLALERGVTLVDTAELYAVPPSGDTYGLTEAYIGNWLAAQPSRRDRIVLASKVAGPGRPWIRDGRDPDSADLRSALEGSLRRLRTERIDLYQLHWPSRHHYHWEGGWDYAPHTIDPPAARDRLAQVLETLGGFVREGKIGHLGFSNDTAWGVMQALKLSETAGLPRLASLQNEYSLLRRSFDLDLAEICHLEDVAMLAYSPLAAGVLTGKYNDGSLPPGTRGAVQGGMYRINPQSIRATERYGEIARRHGMTLAQMALAFCASRPFMTSVLVGATSMAQLEENLDAADIRLSPDVLAEIDAVFRSDARPI
ncbi:Predicted oxidoreductase [Devosia enhydra]|uniref:Predicted oxidoreductase n=1 Tax=Devosia enhydra TaxID=665118 RepID=A0A1K2I2H0_9HYPH|nr:aldo/keto reductase [Devosia enhydra]SFZ86582.1 Predicted oxidoreductase [Devosia enhydra]